MEEQKPEVARLTHVARRLGVSKSVLQYWMLKRAIKPVSTFPVPVYDVQAVKAFLDEYYIPRKPRTGV